MNDFATGYAIGQNDGRSNGGCGFGDMGGGWMWIIVLFALMFGGFGFGGIGGFGGFGGGAGLQGMATRADITTGFQFQELQNAVRGIERGITDATYALNNTVVNGFHNQTVATMNGFSDLSRQLSDCCCENRAAIAQVRYDAATEACATRNLIQTTARDLIDNQNANFRALMDYQVQREMRDKDAKIAELQQAASQSNQNNYLAALVDSKTAEIIRRLRVPDAVPAYVVPNPNCCYGNPVGIGYAGGRANDCGFPCAA